MKRSAQKRLNIENIIIYLEWLLAVVYPHKQGFLYWITSLFIIARLFKLL
jgi:hypothetical protein